MGGITGQTRFVARFDSHNFFLCCCCALQAERLKRLAFRRLRTPVCCRRAVVFHTRSTLRRFIRICFVRFSKLFHVSKILTPRVLLRVCRYASFYRYYVVYRARNIKRRILQLWRAVAQTNQSAYAADPPWALRRCVLLSTLLVSCKRILYRGFGIADLCILVHVRFANGQCRMRAMKANLWSECVMADEYTTMRALFRRWVAYAQGRIARRRVNQLVTLQRQMWLKRVSLWGIYHERDPSLLLRVVELRQPLRNTLADIRTWYSVFFRRVNAGAAVKLRREIHKRRTTIVRQALLRPRLRPVLEQEKQVRLYFHSDHD